jgi:hypothetical protein
MKSRKVVFRSFEDGSIVALFPEIPSEKDPYRCKAYYNGEFEPMSYAGVMKYTTGINEEDKNDEYNKIYDFLTEKMGDLEIITEYKPPKGKTAAEVRGAKFKTREEKEKNITILPKPKTEFREGAVQFGEDDWPGYFMRGDSCMGLVMSVFYVISTLADENGKYSDETSISTRWYLDSLMDLAFKMENEVILTDKESLIAQTKRWQYLNKKKKK